MAKITLEYKGFNIYYDEYDEQWELTNPSGYQNQSLKKVKQYVDRLCKKDFKSFQVYCGGSWNNSWKLATVTSIDEEGQFWLSLENSRQKSSPESCMKITENNNKLIEEITDLNNQITKLEESRNILKTKLEYYNKG